MAITNFEKITVDLTDIPNVNEGERVELWGNNLSVEEIAKKANKIIIRIKIILIIG